MNCRWLAFIFFLLSASCASVDRFAPDTARSLAPEKADQLIESVKGTNELVFPYKAIGRISLHDQEGAWSVRAAWMGADGGRFRLEALGLAGQPFAKIICGSGSCSFYFFSDSEMFHQKTSRQNLGPVTGIDIKVNDLLFLLGGGVNLAGYTKADAYRDDSDDLLLVLKKTFSGIVQVIRFDGDTLRPVGVKGFGRRGVLYQADIHEVSEAGGRYMPLDLSISDSSGNRMHFDVERFWTDMVVPESSFSHELPGKTTGTGSP